MDRTRFDWDPAKDLQNRAKHGVSFIDGQHAFTDPRRVILHDEGHSQDEARFYCLGRVADGILTVRFTYRRQVIRILGAGYWRRGRKIYEEQNQVHG